MDTFPLIVLVGILVIVGLLVLLARFYPGTGADLLDWQPTRSYETEVELEMQDVEQMLEAQNEYRRKRGEREISEDEFRLDVVRDEVRRAPRTTSGRYWRACGARCRCASRARSCACRTGTRRAGA